MKKFALCLFMTCCLFGVRAQNNRQTSATGLYYSQENTRSDTFDILKYTINLDIGNTTNQWIGGNTVVRLAPKVNNQSYVRFDLLSLVVDSVKDNSSLVTYQYNGSTLRVHLKNQMNTTDTTDVTIYYHGKPVIDNSGFGGFYFDNTQNAEYAYNLGVGFDANPHNFGRVWFPCFDNFVERSKYEFNISCDTARRAYCNGMLMSDAVYNQRRTRRWVLNEQIPSYLASVAVARYTELRWPVNTATGTKTILIAAVAADTTAIKTGFQHLKNAIAGFEYYYGPYRWPRFGYCMVPFSSGAMEHATNITYPRSFAGQLGYEALVMAHELSHHWWGDLITCETKEDMWINEGMATYSGYLFQEWQYGKPSYMNAYQTQHEDLLHFLYFREGFRAVSGVPQSLTYGDHVYLKGADIAHTLRGYLGDSAFFKGLRYALNQDQFHQANTLDLRSLIQTGSGKNVTDFFNDWVLHPGWSHFSIDSVRVTGNGPYQVVVGVRQKLFGAPQLHSNVPLEITFYKQDWSSVTQSIVMSGAAAAYTFQLPFVPAKTSLNKDMKIGDATSPETAVVGKTAFRNFPLAKATLVGMSTGGDSSHVRIVHHFVAPDDFKDHSSKSRMGNQHYWSVEGIFSPSFSGKIRFNYDGNKNTSGQYSYMDTILTIVNGDSLALFYRSDAGDDWHWLNNAVKYKGTTRSGQIETDFVRNGEYALANVGDTAMLLGIKQLSGKGGLPWVYPNPNSTGFDLHLGSQPTGGMVQLMDALGKMVIELPANTEVIHVDTSTLPRGAFLVRVVRNGQQLMTQKVIVN